VVARATLPGAARKAGTTTVRRRSKAETLESVPGVGIDLGEKGSKGRGLPSAAVGDEELQVALVLGDGMRGVGLHQPDRERGRVSVEMILTALELRIKGSEIHRSLATVVTEKCAFPEMTRRNIAEREGMDTVLTLDHRDSFMVRTGCSRGMLWAAGIHRVIGWSRVDRFTGTSSHSAEARRRVRRVTRSAVVRSDSSCVRIRSGWERTGSASTNARSGPLSSTSSPTISSTPAGIRS
jgi:hypothetical protein